MSISNLNFAGYTGSKSQVQNRLKIQFVELDYSKFIFQKSSMDQQGESTNLQFYKLLFQPFFSKHNIFFAFFSFTATSPNSNKVASCSFSIHVRDIIPPRVYNCPNDFDIYLDKGNLLKCIDNKTARK